MTSSSQCVPRAFASVVLAASMVSGALAQEARETPEAAAAAASKPRPRKPAPKAAAPEKAAPVRALWPEGATAISESYGDWTMTCSRLEAKPVCLVTQAQGNARTGKREFVIELKAPVDGRAEGTILMPFGYAIEPGVGFKLDETVLGKGAPYAICTLEGCLVPISLPTLATDTMRTAKTLSVSGMKQDAKEPTIIAVPLSGFGAAFSRAIAFSG